VEWIRAIQMQIAKKSHLAGWYSSHPSYCISTLGGCQGGVDQSNPEADCKENHTWQGGFLPSYSIFHPGRLPGWSGSEQSRGRLQGKSHLAEWIPPTVFFLYQSCTNLNFPIYLSGDGPFCNTPTPWTSPLFPTHLTHCATFCKNFFKMTDNPKKDSLWHQHATTAPRCVAFYLIFPLCTTQYFI
jgi:hypothetical protein